ncbi:hypothetical protein [Bacillus sp. OAE603]|uniref:hypothetical protein n=1 Tax=Gottfriedia sp. OAE603 TaxID=2663872 RepID=UPI001789D9BC
MLLKRGLKSGIVVVVCTLIMIACSNKNETSNKIVSTKMKNGDFMLYVKTPKEVKGGKKFNLEGKIKYFGTEETYLLHSSKDIEFLITDKYGRNIEENIYYTGTGKDSKIKNGDTLTEKESFSIKKKGSYKITAMTRFFESNSGKLKDKKYVEMKIENIKLIVK